MELFTKTEIAFVLDAHPKTIETWERDHGLPVEIVGGTGPGKGARYDVQDVVRWHVEREVSKTISQMISQGDHDKDEELGRLRFHQANIASMDEKVRRSELLDAAEVGAAWVNIIMEARATLLSLPLRIAQVAFSGSTMREIEKDARIEVEDALNKLADFAVYVPDSDELIDETEPES